MSLSGRMAWDDVRRLVGASGGPGGKPRDFWSELFGSGESLLTDGEGNDRTALVRALVEQLDRTSELVRVLSERVAVLERLAVDEESRLTREFGKLRSDKGN